MSGRIRVLYVDDEPGLLEIGKLFLEQNGQFTVEILTSAQDGLARINDQAFDAIISDYQMPVMDGIAFLQKVRSSDKSIPFILFTGRGREEVVIQAINNGADFYLQKGGDPTAQFAELAHKIRQAVGMRQAELLRIESEKRLADIINFLPDATFAIDRTGHVIAWNRAIEEMTGVPAGGMIGKGDYEYAIPFYGSRRKILIDLIFEPDDVIIKNYAHIIHEKNVLIADTSLPRPKGNSVTLMGKASPLYDNRGEIVGAIESIRDITERKKAEDAALRAKKDWETIFRAIGHPSIVLDAQNRIIDVNDATLRVTGQSREALTGLRCYEVFHGKDTKGPPSSCPFETMRKTGNTEASEMEVQALDGYYTISCTPVYDPDGNLEKVIHIAMDVTSRRRAEDELRAAYEQITASEEELREQYEELVHSELRVRESEQKYRELAELLPQIVFETDKDFTITFVNRQTYAALGYSPEEAASGFNALSIIDPAQHGRVMENIRRMVTGEPFEHTEYTFRRKDGSTFPGLIYADPVFRNDEMTGFRGIIIDITDRKRIEQALHESELFLKETQKIARLGGWKANPHTDYLEWTDGVYDIIEAPRTYRPGLKEGMKYYAPEDIPVIREKVAACLETGEPFTSEARIITETGKTVWTELRGLSPVIEGMRSYVIGTLQDITDRKIAGNALRESEKRFKTLFERSAEAQLLIDDTGKITDCNAALLTLFALKDKEEILGHSPEDFAPEFQPDGIRSSSRGDEIFSRVMEEGMVQYEWAHRKHDAVRTPVMTEVICTLITIAGQPMIHASIRDITDRKTAQDSLREREATLASIFRAAPTGIGMVVNRVIMKVNDRLCDMTGYQAEELLGKSARVLYASDEDYEYVGREKYEQIRKSGTGTVETRWQRKDGTIFNVLLSSTPIDPADHSKGVTFTALDITDRKRQERIQKEQLELGLALQKVHGLTEMLETCLASAIRVSDMDAGAIYLADPVTGSFNLAVAQNLSSAFASSVSHFPADSVNARMVMAGKPVYVPFGAAGILHTPAQEREGLRAAAFFPITSGGRVAASLNVASRILNEVPDTARLAIETIATQIGAALERIRSEEALHLKDRAIASSINAIVISDMDGRITYVNDAFTRLWGYTAQESLGMPVTRLGRSDEEVEKFLARFRTQGYAIGESIAKRKDGSPFVIQVSGSLVADETGQPQAMLSSFVDITGHRQAEESLRRAYEQITTSEEELRSQFNELAATQEELQKQQQQLAEVANMVPGVVYQFYARPDGTRGLYYVSSRASDIFGFPDDTDDFYSWFTAHVDPRDRDAFLRSNDDVIASVSPWDFEGRFIRPSGEEIWFQGMSRPIRRGSELVFNGVLLDITDRKQAELAIRENEQKYRTLVETTGTGYVIVDERGNVLDANPEYVRLTGHTGLAEIAGRNVLEWTAEYEREKNAQAVQQCVRDGFIRNFEIDYTGAAGTITPIEINATVMESGGSVRILTLCRDISERKKSQDALKASETKFRTVVETAEEGIWIVSRDYLTLFTNRKMQELFGYPMEEMAGRPVWDFVSPEEVGSMKQQLSGRPRGISGRYEQRWIRKDGTAFWCLTSSTPLFSSDGTFAGSFGMFTDISVRKEMDAALQESEARYRTVVEQSNDAIFIAQDGILVFHNPAFSAMTGYADAELAGRSIADLIAPEDRDLVLMRHRERLGGKSLPETYEFSVLHHDGTTRIRVVMNVSPATIAGKPATIGTLHDVTRERMREAALQESEEKYRTLIENVQDIIYRTDCNGNLIMASPSFLTLLGYESPEECIGKNIADQFWVEPASRKDFIKALNANGSISGYDIVLKKKDGSPLTVSASSHFYYAKDGTVAGVEGIFHDITAIREANRKLNLLSSITRHDVTNQLLLMQGYAQIAAMKKSDPVIADLLAKISTGARVISHLIEFTRTYQDLGIQSPGWFRLDELVEKEKRGETVVSDACRQVEILADPMLGRVFLNIFDNAIRHGGNVTRITVGCEEAQEGLVISIGDNGTGIAAGEKEKIFGRGYGKNTGLGLFLVREILSITGITIRETGEPGKGARFEIVVPKGAWRAGNSSS